MSVFNIGRQFSDDPQGRYYKDCTGSGEEFREEHLRKELDALKSGEILTIIMDDNVDGYGSSFLTEGFAGMVKYGYMQKDELLSKIKFQYSDSDFAFYEKKIRQYISEAVYNSEKYVPTKPLGA
ncbi:STAS-like domain-containing protein [Vibrio fluvialis]|nr:STAS-like domain-containing protein [Vibrio fluvialis]